MGTDTKERHLAQTEGAGKTRKDLWEETILELSIELSTQDTQNTGQYGI